jgi:hypothetical protein
MERGPAQPDHALVVHHSIGRRIDELAQIREPALPSLRA